jgi:L-ribulose-5-phosphate 4-epimerase
LTPTEIESEYETNTGHVIVEAFQRRDPLACPAVLVANHGPFAWGTSVEDAVHHAVVLEYVIRLAGETFRLCSGSKAMPRALLNKHFFRKHGPGAYYGQRTAAKQAQAPNHK